MSKIAIVIDSTAAFPHDKIGAVPIVTIPLQLIWGEEFFRDGVDLTAEEFYQKLKKSRLLPSTSQPSPKTFVDVYKKLLQDDYQVLSVHLSAKISGTYDTALQAKKILRNPEALAVIDSQTLSLGTNLLIQAVAEQANKGASFEECIAFLEAARERCRVYCAVRNIRYLVRGGRVSGLKGSVGQLVGIRPLLVIRDGEIVAEKGQNAFGVKQARTRLMRRVLSDLEGKRLVNIAAAYTDNRPMVETMMRDISESYGLMLPKNAVVSPLSPVIGAHTGPGAFGIAILFHAENH